MEHIVEKLSGNKVKISFTAPADVFEDAVGKAYLKNRNRISVPGFRKGKAPRKLMERMYGEAIFYDDALEIIFPSAYREAVETSGLVPVSQPELDVETIQPGQDVKFSCEVYVQPDVTLGAYKGLEVVRTLRPVEQDAVDARIKQEQKRVARSVEVTDRAVEDGDEVTLDYAGSVDGVPFEGGTAQEQKLLIGSQSFIPGFEEQVVGMNVGEEKDLSVRFPDEYHSEALKGKDAVFHVKINAVTREELPELDDEFASEVSDFDTLKEFTDNIRSGLQQTADAQSTEAAKQSMVQQIVDNAQLDIPAPMVEEKLDDLLSEMNWRMQQQGFDMKKYLQLTGQTEEQMRDMYRGEAANNLKTELVMEEIIKAEDVQPSEADVEAMMEDYAKATGKNAETLKAELSDAQKAYFQHRSKITQTLEMLWNSAKVTDVTQGEAAKPDAQENTDDKPVRKPRAARLKAEGATDGAQG
jgi:trigger factor